jgi:molybdate transport system substrate-binding protein
MTDGLVQPRTKRYPLLGQGAPVALVVFLTATMLIASCGGAESGRVAVFAAASTTDVVTALAADFGEPVSPSFGSSSSLARQIADGAPADVFISANRRWIDYLHERQRLDGDAIVFATNRLVCVTPPGASPLDSGAQHASPLRALLGSLGPRDRVAIADEGVPAGEYARQSLRAAGLLEQFQPRLVGQADVRAVLRAVANREVAAGFVFATDARGVDVLFEMSGHEPIEYFAAVVKDARNANAARRFVEYLRGEKAREVLTQAGFTLPNESEPQKHESTKQ